MDRLIRLLDEGPKPHRLLAAGGILVVILAVLAMAPVLELDPTCLKGSIVDLELAGTEARAAEVLAPCRSLDPVRDTLRGDYLFLVAYGLLTAALAGLLGPRAYRGTAWRRAAPLVAAIAVLAALLDLVENTLLLQALDNESGGGSFRGAAGAATLKFLLIYPALAYTLVALVRWVLHGSVASTPEDLRDPGSPEAV